MEKKLPLAIRWHGRGGQGVVTASRILASTALKGGYYLQSLPDFGAERSGAPIAAYTRISETPPVDRGPVDEPDVIIVLDSSLIGQVDMLDGLAPDGIVILNTPDPSPAAIAQLDLGPQQEIWALNASQIAMDLLRRNLPNTPVLGAFARAIPVLDMDTISLALEELLSERFNETIIKANLEALRLGHDQAQQVEVTADV
ncbi:MAG: 2-oxoacid:acceptor oxidoreductase family protein [Dehalococcoidia bacterium]|jgi:pyruvate ferredoxin oxidoreductase gamma subunit|nr:2-oxoacid:acceptor oxidoreductase family protein [Dehalococcoidia bacterium]